VTSMAHQNVLNILYITPFHWCCRGVANRARRHHPFTLY